MVALKRLSRLIICSMLESIIRKQPVCTVHSWKRMYIIIDGIKYSTKIPISRYYPWKNEATLAECSRAEWKRQLNLLSQSADEEHVMPPAASQAGRFFAITVVGRS